MSWGFPGMLKRRSDKDVVSNRWESIRFVFRGSIPLASRDIQVQSFGHITSSNLKLLACSQMLAFLAAFINMLSWTLADT